MGRDLRLSQNEIRRVGSRLWFAANAVTNDRARKIGTAARTAIHECHGNGHELALLNEYRHRIASEGLGLSFSMDTHRHKFTGDVIARSVVLDLRFRNDYIVLLRHFQVRDVRECFRLDNGYWAVFENVERIDLRERGCCGNY